MLDAVDKRCPAMNRLFNRYYGHHSPCLYQLDDMYHVIMSQEGSRMGCVLGSFGFDLNCARCVRASGQPVPRCGHEGAHR